jgi:hypothetical protein
MSRKSGNARFGMGSWVLLWVCAACTGGGVTDPDGRPADPLAENVPATVLVFVATSCPLSNRYAPEIRRLHEAFAARGVAMYLVYPTASEPPSAIRAHLRDYDFGTPALRDPFHTLVKRAGATVTPEAAVFRHGQVAYLGRIDDRQVAFGVTRAEPTSHDLEAAVASVLSGRTLDERYAPAIGCSIGP